MNKRKLSIRQQELLNLIDEYQKQYNVIPTLVELAQKMGISVAGVSQKIDVLQRKKVLERHNVYIIK